MAERPPTGLRRLYAVEFDPLAQRHLVERGATPFGDDPLRAFVAILRLANLLGETVVLIDSSIFDGCLFHRIGPRRLLRLAGRPVQGGVGSVYPFEILSRAPTLEQSLLQSVRTTDGRRGRLRSYEFFGLDVPEPERVAYGERLGLVSVRELDRRVARYGVTEGIARVLVECCGVPPEPVARMRAHWEEWIAEDRAGRLDLKVWTGMGRFSDDAFAWDPVETMLPDIRSELGRTALAWTYENRHLRRTHIRSALRTLLPDDDPVLRADRDVIEFWYNACYQRAMAYAQGAELIEFVLGDPRSVPTRRLRRRHGARGPGESRRVVLPASLMAALGTMPPSVFETVLYRNRDAIAEWRATGDPQAMRRIAYGLLETVEQPNPASTRRIVVNFALVIMGAVIVEFFDDLRLAEKIPLVAAAALAASWEQLSTEIRLRGRLGAVIDVRGGPSRASGEAS